MNLLRLRTNTLQPAGGDGGVLEPRGGRAVMADDEAWGDSVRGAGASHLRTTLGAETSAISAARRGLWERLQEWGLGPIADQVVLAAHELLANAVVHGCRGAAAEACRVTLTARCSPTSVRVTVKDPSTEVPRRRLAGEECESGRGLDLVDLLADRWGATAEPDGSGKTVWLELDTPLCRRAPLT